MPLLGLVRLVIERGAHETLLPAHVYESVEIGGLIVWVEPGHFHREIVDSNYRTHCSCCHLGFSSGVGVGVTVIIFVQQVVTPAM